MSEKKVIVIYSGLGPVSMPLGKSAGAVAVIKPGTNNIDVDVWKQMKKQPDIMKMLERGEKDPKGFNEKTGLGNLHVKGWEPGSDDNEAREGLDGLNAVDAKALVAETYNTELLREWLEKESRAGVINAVEKQLKTIEDERVKNENK